MGYFTALDLADNFDLEVGLRHHITSNHYPPLPVEYVDIAQKAINLYNSTVDCDYLVELPQDLNPLPRNVQWIDDLPHATVGTLIDILHLDSWLIDPDSDDFLDQDFF